MHLPLSGFPALLQAVEIRLVGQVPPAFRREVVDKPGIIEGRSWREVYFVYVYQWVLSCSDFL